MALEFHRGRLIDHIQLRCADLDASKRFYAAVLEAFGLKLVEISPELIVADELCLTPANGDPTSRIHIALQTENREDVDRFYAAALGAGGRDHGKPGERSYHPNYYAAFVLDPDGNNIEAVHHGNGARSAASVVITAPG